MSPRNLLRLAAIGIVAGLIAAASAAGHSSTVSTSPASGARLAAAPPSVRVTYAGPLLSVEAVRARVGDRSVLAGPPRLDPANARRLVIPVSAAGPGDYRVDWIVVGADGHPVSGETSFTVRPSPLQLAVRRVVEALRRAVRALTDSVAA